MRTLNDIPPSLQEDDAGYVENRAFIFGLTLKSFLIRATILIMPVVASLAFLLTDETHALPAGRILMLTFLACLPGIALVCGAEFLESLLESAFWYRGSLFLRSSPAWFVRGTGYAFAIGLSIFYVLAMFL